MCPGLPQFEQRAEASDDCRTGLVFVVSTIGVMRLEGAICWEYVEEWDYVVMELVGVQ